MTACLNIIFGSVWCRSQMNIVPVSFGGNFSNVWIFNTAFLIFCWERPGFWRPLMSLLDPPLCGKTTSKWRSGEVFLMKLWEILDKKKTNINNLLIMALSQKFGEITNKNGRHNFYYAPPWLWYHCLHIRLNLKKWTHICRMIKTSFKISSPLSLMATIHLFPARYRYKYI